MSHPIERDPPQRHTATATHKSRYLKAMATLIKCASQLITLLLSAAQVPRSLRPRRRGDNLFNVFHALQVALKGTCW